MEPHKIIRVALIGPESTGKTTLCKLLAAHYNTLWVHEYARDYIAALKRTYTLEDILFTAKEQFKLEEDVVLKASKLLFIDTEFIISKVWCEDVFGKCPAWIERMIKEKQYDLYLLLRHDIPWQHDSVRENPHRREYFYNLYLRELQSRNYNYKIISGLDEKREENAIKAVDEFLKGHS